MIMVERLKQEGTSHCSSDLFKICVKTEPTGEHRFSYRRVRQHLGLVLTWIFVTGRPDEHLPHSSQVRSGRILLDVWRDFWSGYGV